MLTEDGKRLKNFANAITIDEFVSVLQMKKDDLKINENSEF